MNPDAKHHLYRCFDAAGALLYVGMSFSAFERLSKHKVSSPWFGAVAAVKIETFESRADVRKAEVEAIVKENPRHNKRRKQEQKIELRAAEHVAADDDDVVQILDVDLIYSSDEIGALLRTGAGKALNKLIASGELRSISLPNKAGRERPMFTGWDVIEFLQSRRKGKR